MRFENLNLHISHFRREIEKFLSLTSRQHWEGAIQKIETSSIFYRNYQYIRNPLIEPIKTYLNLDKKGISINNYRTKEIIFLAEQAFIINEIIHHLNEKAKKSIVSRIKDSDIRSILFELMIAAHFLRNQYDVEFIEYERKNEIGKTFDLLIKRDDIVAEIECKSKSYEAGRKIGRDSFYQLSDLICRKLKIREISCLIDIKTNDKLTSNQSKLNEIADNVISLIKADNLNLNEQNDYSIKIIPLETTTTIDSKDSLKDIVAPYKSNNCHIASMSAVNDNWNIIVRIESESKDKIVLSIFEELKKAKSQFSKKHPGLLAVRIEGVEPNEWEMLNEESSLSEMTKHFFETEHCPFIHTISYSSAQMYVKDGNNIDSRTKNLIFENPYTGHLPSSDIFRLRPR